MLVHKYGDGRAPDADIVGLQPEPCAIGEAWLPLLLRRRRPRLHTGRDDSASTLELAPEVDEKASGFFRANTDDECE